MAAQVPVPALDRLAIALDLFARSLVQQGQALRRESQIALELDSSSEWASLVAKYHNGAPFLVRNAAQQEAIAARIDEARGALIRPAAGGMGSIMRSAGTALDNATPFFVLKAAGRGLARAGEQLTNGQAQAAAQVLRDTALEINKAKSVTLEQP
jgi:hypothetical protein